MKSFLSVIATLGAVVFLFWFGGCSYQNVNNIKAHAESVWNQAGYQIIGYEGYQIGSIFGQPGGKVWYIVKRRDKDGVTYEGFISKWFNEYHIYDLHAIDAIQPK